MKNLGLFISIITAFSVYALADLDAHQPTRLESDMKQIGTLFKAIGQQASVASANADSAAKAGQLVTLFKECLNETPDSIAQMPADQKTAAIAEYQNLLNAEIADSIALQQDFLNNDNTAALALLQQMADDKKTGHDDFKH